MPEQNINTHDLAATAAALAECCGDDKSRGRLCPYHQGYEDGMDALLDLLVGWRADRERNGGPGG